ncbi:hypothetical protein C8T65DRAFT_748831 [Cerioporus squamosus]|nr:hypothetical protein C8T65DRAFT_748831 [Cerioporus squamosus]
MFPPRDLRSPSASPPRRTQVMRSPSVTGSWAPGSPAAIQDEDEDDGEEELVKPYSDDYANVDFGMGFQDQEDEANDDLDLRQNVLDLFNNGDVPQAEGAHNGRQDDGHVEHGEGHDNAGVDGADNGGMNAEDCGKDRAESREPFEVVLDEIKQDIDDMVDHTVSQVGVMALNLVGAAGAQSVTQTSPSGSRAASVAPEDAAKALLQALGLGGADETEDARLMMSLLKHAAKLKPKKASRKSTRIVR